MICWQLHRDKQIVAPTVAIITRPGWISPWEAEGGETEETLLAPVHRTGGPTQNTCPP